MATPWLVDVLEELVITALFRLECYVLRDDEFVSADAVQRLVDELFLMNAKELTSEFEGMGRRPGQRAEDDADPITRAEFDQAKRTDYVQRIRTRASSSRDAVQAERTRWLNLLATVDAVRVSEGRQDRNARSITNHAVGL